MTTHKRQKGFNLIELMVAMVIGIFLVAGALRVYTQSQAALVVSEQSARLQENARYALQFIERDVRAADLWGLTNESLQITGSADATLPVDPLTANTGDCEDNWSININVAIEGANNSNPYPNTCIPSTRFVANSDVLVVRHAESNPIDEIDLENGVLYIRSSNNNGILFEGPNQPTGIAADGINSKLSTAVYWVSNASDHDASIPSLRRSYLSTNGNDPIVVSEEVISGVEDLQIQYGVDTTDDQSVNMYVDYDDVADPDTILVARVWLRVRAERTEVGYTEDVTYTYADRSYNSTDSGDSDEPRYRRLLVTKTIEMRNRRSVTSL
ncbi:MAG: PilW family protein [Gammaproteobacteria bacterium]